MKPHIARYYSRGARAWRWGLWRARRDHANGRWPDFNAETLPALDRVEKFWRDLSYAARLRHDRQCLH